jgi:hypothetical protein
LETLSIPHSSLTKAGLIDALETLPNIESLEVGWNEMAAFGPVGGPPFSGFNEAELFGALSPQDVAECRCPKLSVIDCSFYGRGSEEAGKAVANFVEKRRSTNRPSTVAWVDKVSIEFSILPGWDVRQELERRGADVEGLSFATR